MIIDYIPQRYLGIGEIYVTTKAEQITTVLGSCVSVCLYDAKNGVSGINHHMFPALPSCTKPGDNRCGRYGETALPELIKRMKRLGMKPESASAKIFGGARTFARASIGLIGEQNVAIARDFLRQQGIRVVAEDVGGDRGRRILFQTGTGRVLVQRIGKREYL